MVYTRLDIIYIARMLVRYQSSRGSLERDKESVAISLTNKRLKITYKRTNYLEVIDFSDSDFAKCKRRQKVNFKVHLYVSRHVYLVEES